MSTRLWYLLITVVRGQEGGAAKVLQSLLPKICYLYAYELDDILRRRHPEGIICIHGIGRLIVKLMSAEVKHQQSRIRIQVSYSTRPL